MSPSARLTLGIRFIRKKSRATDKLDELLDATTDQIDPGRVFIDREFYDGDAVRALRKYVDSNWVIHAKKQADVKDVVKATPRGEFDGTKNIGKFADPKPN